MCATPLWGQMVRHTRVLNPHPGDQMTTEAALEVYDEQTLEVSQENCRTSWKDGQVSCLTRNSVVILRFHRRVMHGSEQLRVHGFFCPDDEVGWQVSGHRKQTALAGLGFNGFCIAALFLAMQVYMPAGVLHNIMSMYGVTQFGQ